MSQHTHDNTQTLHVEGMHCASCASIISKTLQKMDGVEACEVNVGTEKANVTFDSAKTNIAAMNKRLDTLGYKLHPANQPEQHMSHGEHSEHNVHEGHDMMTPITSDEAVKERKLKELAKLREQLTIVLPFTVLSFALMMWEVGADSLKILPEMPDALMVFMHHLLPVMATYTLFVIGLSYLKGLLRFMKHGVANMDTLVGMGTLVAYLYSFLISAFEKVLAPLLNVEQTYYDVTIVVIGFITLGKYLESRSKLQTGEAIEKLLHLQAKSALVLRNGKEIVLPLEEVVVGDVVIVKPGQKIPLDGVIIDGSSSVDEAVITGESMPVDKQKDDLVIGATMNKQGVLHVRVSKVGKDTMLAQIITMVEQAQGSKAPIEKLADQVSAVFVPVVLGFAVIVFLAWLLIGSQFMPMSQAFTLGLLSFVGVLVIACPCAMGLATPTAVIVGVGKAAENGILIKNAENLEKFSAINYIVMDKTGTLTKGEPELVDSVMVGDMSGDLALQLLASLEKSSEHPLAQAVLQKADKMKLALLPVSKFKVLEGKGLMGEIKGTEFAAGNRKLAQELKVDIDTTIIDKFAEQGKTPIILFKEKEVVAYFAVADTVKDDAAEVIQQLHAEGVKVAMLTGDTEATAKHIASQLGIDKVIAEVLPGDKAQEIKRLQAEGYYVAMAGDGINDAPALATADVGVAMGTGTDVAIESAGITLLGGQLSKLPKAVKLAQATMSTVKQNLFWAFFYNVIGIPVAAGLLYPFFGILLSPVVAGGAMAFSSVSVVLNALRLKTVKV
jgi:Cu2+-exporting ATPase/Cu+-exporting ATPase